MEGAGASTLNQGRKLAQGSQHVKHATADIFAHRFPHIALWLRHHLPAIPQSSPACTMPPAAAP